MLVDLTSLVTAAVWPFVRIAALVMVAPGFAGGFVPVRVRVVLAVLMAAIIAPLVATPAGVDPFSAAGLLITLQEFLIGLAMGLVVQFVFDAVVLAGNLVATSMGLGFAMIVDPQRGVSVPVLSQLFLILGLLVYVSLDGHTALIGAVAASFTSAPIGAALPWQAGAWSVVSWAGMLFAIAVQIALPVVTAIVVVNLAFAVASRAAPTLNLFSVGFPAALILGLVVIALGLGGIVANMVSVLEQIIEILYHTLLPGLVP